jgi:type II secretory pathway component GspD/PulD (secretin)
MKLRILFAIAFTFLGAFAYGENAKPKLKAGPGQTVPMDPAKQDGKINADFPEPTDIRDIARAFSLWTGTEYAVDDSVKAKVKLNSPERVTKEEALKRFHKMLASYNLKSVENGSGYRIVND